MKITFEINQQTGEADMKIEGAKNYYDLVVLSDALNKAIPNIDSTIANMPYKGDILMMHSPGMDELKFEEVCKNTPLQIPLFKE
jgi:hypothetical protein